MDAPFYNNERPILPPIQFEPTEFFKKMIDPNNSILNKLNLTNINTSKYFETEIKCELPSHNNYFSNYPFEYPIVSCINIDIPHIKFEPSDYNIVSCINIDDHKNPIVFPIRREDENEFVREYSKMATEILKKYYTCY